MTVKTSNNASSGAAFKSYLSEARVRVNSALEARLPAGEASSVAEAMRYAVFAGGKRLRPILALAASEAVGGDEADAMPAACALEMIHTYSLIHDDLPAMDHDRLRRGVPTCWVKYGEGLAVLAGDALLTYAFEVLAEARPKGGDAAWLIGEVARGAGFRGGMIGGQVRDIEAEGSKPDARAVRAIHLEKTAALIRTSVVAGAWSGGAHGRVLDQLRVFGEAIGLAFQVKDDILDVTASSRQLGKTAGKDEKSQKQTWPAAVGMAEAERELERLVERAREALARSGVRGERLEAIAEYIITRRR